MNDDSQIVVPASFIALYVAPGKIKPALSRPLLIERYEFCEDLAQMLSEQARTKQWELGISQDIVMERMASGLANATDWMTDAELSWVMTRLKELLDMA